MSFVKNQGTLRLPDVEEVVDKLGRWMNRLDKEANSHFVLVVHAAGANSHLSAPEDTSSPEEKSHHTLAE